MSQTGKYPNQVIDVSLIRDTIGKKLADKKQREKIDQRRRSSLLSSAGIPESDHARLYDEQFARQEGHCALCTKTANEFDAPLSWDHDHANGKLRGLLCRSCNYALGIVENSLNHPVWEYLRYNWLEPPY